MWEVEAFITTTIFGGGLAWGLAWAGVGVTRDGTVAIHGMATAGIPITVMQVITRIADPTITDMTVTTDTVGMTDILVGILKIVVAILRVWGVPQLHERVEIRTAEGWLHPQADLFRVPQRPGHNSRPIVLA
jgi:acyl CoA:acetate/3-ketoacid CoA transferase alpha subunit